MITEYITWLDRPIHKEVRTRSEGDSTVFEYRLDQGAWIETHRIIWPEPKLKWWHRFWS